MKYLLDTNACISYLNNPQSAVRERMQAHNPADIVLCAVVEAELHYGVMKSAKPVENMAKLDFFLKQFFSFPFNSDAAKVFGCIRATLAKSGNPIGPYDLQIAAIAILNDLTLVSHNVREFTRISDLRLEDWE